MSNTDPINKVRSGSSPQSVENIDFFIEKYSGADDGLYVVNKKAFIKRGNEIAPVSLDSIIG